MHQKNVNESLVLHYYLFLTHIKVHYGYFVLSMMHSLHTTLPINRSARGVDYWLSIFFLLCVECLQHSVVHCGLHLSLKTGRSSGWHQVRWRQSKPLDVFSFPSMSLACVFCFTCFFSHDVNRLLCSTAVFRFCCASSYMVCVAILADCVVVFFFSLSVVFEWRMCISWISARESERWMGVMERVDILHKDMWGRSAELTQRLCQSHVRESCLYMLENSFQVV